MSTSSLALRSSPSTIPPTYSRFHVALPIEGLSLLLLLPAILTAELAINQQRSHNRHKYSGLRSLSIMHLHAVIVIPSQEREISYVLEMH